MIHIKRIQKEDLPRLATLYRELIDKETSLDGMHSVFALMEDNPHYIVLIAQENKEVVGSVMGVLCLDLFGKCNPFMVVENMIVSNSRRQSGIGTLLMRELERQARLLDCNYMLLVSSSERKIAHSFYEKLGFDQKNVRGFKKYLHE
jgi:predicted N-acetyltransferase YhbS